MSGYKLPPLSHLPQWTRVGRLGNTPSPLRLPLIQQPANRNPATASRRVDVEQRVASLQRNLEFLEEQHRDTLEWLHGEMEHLRRENKELKYKLIMEAQNRNVKIATLPEVSRCQQHTVGLPVPGKNAGVGVQLEGALQDTRPQQDHQLNGTSGDEINPGSSWQDHNVKGGDLIASLQPLRIHVGPVHPPRPPTLPECEVIIRHLYNANSSQSQEIVRVKSLLREIVLSKKINPETHILTKAHLVDGTRKTSEEKKFPKLHQTFPEQPSGPSCPSVVFPALKQNLSSTIADRQRRTRTLQRERFKRALH